MQDPIFTEETTEEDLRLARALLAERSAEEIAAALVRIHRAACPRRRRSWMPARTASRASARTSATAQDERSRAVKDPGPGFVRGRTSASTGRHGVVPHERRTAQQRRSALAAADHLPPWPRDQEGDRHRSRSSTARRSSRSSNPTLRNSPPPCARPTTRTSGSSRRKPALANRAMPSHGAGRRAKAAPSAMLIPRPRRARGTPSRSRTARGRRTRSELRTNIRDASERPGHLPAFFTS